MRILILAAAAIALASCTTPTTTATNAANPQQAAGPNRDEQPPVPAQLHRPALRINGGVTQGFGGRY